MKNLLYFILLISFTAHAQDDTTTVKASWYARVMPYTLYTGFGYIPDRVSQSVEIGRSYGIIDFGASYGRISLRPDSTQFAMGKVTMNACQIGLFSNEFTVGVGHVFNKHTPFIFELSSTLFAQLGHDWGIGLVTGGYDISGNTYDYTKSYVGLYLRFGLQRTEGGFLINRRFKTKRYNKRY